MKIHDSRSEHGNLTRLIERGATVDVRDHKGRTCLHEVVSWCQRKEPSKNGFHGALDRMDFLIDLGLNPKAVDHAGNTLLHELSRQQGSVSMWKYLVYRLELDMAQVNVSCRQPSADEDVTFH
jgi:ankyrin repeat protein